MFKRFQFQVVSYLTLLSTVATFSMPSVSAQDYAYGPQSPDCCYQQQECCDDGWGYGWLLLGSGLIGAAAGAGVAYAVSNNNGHHGRAGATGATGTNGTNGINGATGATGASTVFPDTGNSVEFILPVTAAAAVAGATGTVTFFVNSPGPLSASTTVFEETHNFTSTIPGLFTFDSGLLPAFIGDYTFGIRVSGGAINVAAAILATINTTRNGGSSTIETLLPAAAAIGSGVEITADFVYAQPPLYP